MATIYELDKKRKNILLNMEEKEITALYDKINKKAIDSLGTVKNNFTFNLEEILKSNKELEETNNILIKKYSNIQAIGSNSRLNLLTDKYEEVLNEAEELIYYIHYKELSNTIHNLVMNISYLESVLTKFYFRYSFRYGNLEKLLLEELKVPEDVVLDKLEPFIYGNNFFYDKSLENDFNSFIEEIDNNIAVAIATINDYLEVKVVPSAYSEEAIIKVIEGFIQLQILATSSIKLYEELKLNPFENAITIEAEVKANLHNDLLKKAKYTFEETSVEAEKEKLLTNAPSYNFETFELVLPTNEDGVVN